MMRVALVLALSGCAFTAVAPRTKDPSVAPDCTRDADGRIAADVIAGSVLGVVAIVGLVVALGNAGDDESSRLTDAGIGMAIGGGATSALFVGSAVAGRNAARACRAADQRHATWAQNQR